MLPKDTLNSKIEFVCEFHLYLLYAEKKNVTIDEKTTFSGANSVIIKRFYFIFIKCRTDKNHVHIESLYLIGY